MWVNHILLSSLSAGEHLSCSHFLASMNDAAVYVHIQVFMCTYFQFFGYVPRSGIADSMLTLCLIFRGTDKLFAKAFHAPLYIPTSNVCVCKKHKDLRGKGSAILARVAHSVAERPCGKREKGQPLRYPTHALSEGCLSHPSQGLLPHFFSVPPS